MLTAEQLDSFPDELITLFDSYQQSVLNDIARRLLNTDMTSTAAWQMQRLLNAGAVYNYALDELSRITGKSEQTLLKMFNKAGVKTLQFDNAIYTAAGFNPAKLQLSPAMLDVLKSGYNRTAGLMKNLVATTALSGQEAPFSDIEDWKNLLPEATITGIKNPLFAYFKYPLANNIDPASPLGVSCYSRAVDLIEQADLQWSNLLWEFESGQRALYADVVAFDKTDDGKPILPQKRLYRALNGGSNIGDNPEGLFHEWTPTLREQNYLNGLDSILKKIEFLCGIAYGTISDPQTVDKTATEITTSKQRTYSTISDTQKSLKQALEQLLYAMDTWATLNRLAPKGKYAAKFDFDDSIIVDKDAQFQQDLRLVTAGIMSKLEFRMRNFGEDEAAAKAALAMQTEEQPEEPAEEGI